MKQRERQYWAFRANPRIYKIDEVLKDGVEVEYWNNPHNSDIRAGDRAIPHQVRALGRSFLVTRSVGKTLLRGSLCFRTNTLRPPVYFCSSHLSRLPSGARRRIPAFSHTLNGTDIVIKAFNPDSLLKIPICRGILSWEMRSI